MQHALNKYDRDTLQMLAVVVPMVVIVVCQMFPIIRLFCIILCSKALERCRCVVFINSSDINLAMVGLNYEFQLRSA